MLQEIMRSKPPGLLFVDAQTSLHASHILPAADVTAVEMAIKS